MTLTEILKQKDVSSQDKLIQLADIITTVRKTYGNSDITVEVPYVNTTDGMVEMKYLDADSKVALAERQVKAATIEAVEICETNSACVFDRELESILATDPIMCSLLATTGSKYI